MRLQAANQTVRRQRLASCISQVVYLIHDTVPRFADYADTLQCATQMAPNQLRKMVRACSLLSNMVSTDSNCYK